MDCFKLKPGANRVFLIAQSEYLQQTKREEPYCNRDEKGGDHFYAVCPECDNPIQIIGLFRDTIEAGKKPYGRHHKGEIPHLAKYDEEDYLNCSYSNPRWKKTDAKRSRNSKLSKEVLRLMHEQYDRVIYVLSQDIELRISRPMAKKMLQYFIHHEAWLYRMATLNNLPWILGETSPSMPLYGQWVVRGSELQQVIERKCPAALFQDTASPHYAQLKHKKGMYLDVRFFFLCHEKRLDADGNHLEESIDFEVTSENECIYRKTIEIRTDYFLNLIHLPEVRTHCNEGYLEIAHTLIDPSLFR